MTTEQFLSHLGIEVGKPFMYDDDGKNVKMTCVFEGGQFYLTTDFGSLFSGVTYLMNKEITPLPKYTLTEDEKTYVRITTVKNIYRLDGLLSEKISNSSFRYLNIDNTLFPFICDGLEVNIETLRKCL